MQARTSGKRRSNAKNSFYTPGFGRGRAIFHLRTSFPNIEMHMSPCKPVLNMCSINSQMNIQGLDSCLPPVAKKRSNGQKRGAAQISSVMDPTPNTTKKPSIGKSGVHLRYYKTGEYRNLTNEQKEELKEWRANNPNTFKAGSKKAKKEAPKKSKQSMKKQVASLVEAALNKSVKFDDQVNDEESISCPWFKQQSPKP